MNKGLVIGIFFVLALVGSYCWWEFSPKPEVKAWDLVPDHALVAYPFHANTATDPTDRLVKPFLTDSIAKKIFGEKSLLISAHIVSHNEIGFVLYLSADTKLEKDLVTSWQNNHSYRERTFDGFNIREGASKGKKTIALTSIGSVLVISSSSLLVEEVIRQTKAKDHQGFTYRHHALFQSAKNGSDSASYYGDLSQLSRFLNVFHSTPLENAALAHMGRSLVADVRREKDDIQFSGFADDSISGTPGFLSLFNRQRPVPVTLPKVVSSRTGMLAHFGISDFPAWNQDRLAFSDKHNPEIADSVKTLKSLHSFDSESFYLLLDGEAGLCHSGAFSAELFMVKVNDPHRAEAQLEKLDRKKGPDQLPAENFSHYQIHFLSLPTLPRTLFWPLVSRKMSYYAVADKYVIFSEKLDDLKSFLSDLDSENTWGKSSAWNAFLSTSQDTNVGVIFDGPNWWPSLRNSLSPYWQAYGDSVHIMNVDKGSFQLSRLERSYYFNGIIRFGQQNKRSTNDDKEKIQGVELPSPVAIGLAVVKNHNNGKRELLFQDEAHFLQLFSSDLKNLFSTRMDGTIRSDIYQIDFLKNKKLQYLFATDKSLCLIDRLGKPVQGFPVDLPSGPVQFLSVLDYDQNRNYRYLIADKKGTLLLLDRDGKVVPEWKKIDLKSELLVAPRAIRSQGKDFIIAVTVDGLVYSFNRKGELQNGFPVATRIRPAGNWSFGTIGEKDVITLVNHEGAIVLVDTKGKIVDQSNLPKGSANSVFSLALSSDHEHYVISRIDRTRIAVLNGQGEVIWENENPGSEQLVLSWVDLGHGKAYFSFTDPQQEFAHVFDEKGKAIFPRPLESINIPAVIVEKNGEANFYCFNRNVIRNYSTRRSR